MKKAEFNKRNFLIRLIAAPFIFGLLLITHNFFALKRFWHFLKFGGEYVNFEKDERHTILEIYKMLEEMKNERKND
jgi:hypothetical protein